MRAGVCEASGQARSAATSGQRNLAHPSPARPSLACPLRDAPCASFLCRLCLLLLLLRSPSSSCSPSSAPRTRPFQPRGLTAGASDATDRASALPLASPRSRSPASPAVERRRRRPSPAAVPAARLAASLSFLLPLRRPGQRSRHKLSAPPRLHARTLRSHAHLDAPAAAVTHDTIPCRTLARKRTRRSRGWAEKSNISALIDFAPPAFLPAAPAARLLLLCSAGAVHCSLSFHALQPPRPSVDQLLSPDHRNALMTPSGKPLAGLL